ncbi:MAG: amidase [Thermoleophilia bacterium]|nr:amidase [Thermoleophilia bacterium]
MTTSELVDDPELRCTLSAVEATQLFLERIESEQPRLNAMITITPEFALTEARRVDRARVAGRPLSLDGMPIVIKDNVDVAGVPTTVGSRLFAGRMATADAEVVRRLRAAGAVILGKANMHELAFGGTSRNETFGHVLNPAAPGRIPGGSSGGSGAAVAADLCVAAIGTDTGGSVRLPASLCGVSGLRPTFGAVSNGGVQPVSRSLDTVGPLARSVEDVYAVLGAIVGFDPDDPSSVDGHVDLAAPVSVDGLRIGIVDLLLDASDPAVAACVREAADVFRELGATLTHVELPGTTEAIDVCGRVIKAEALAVYGDDLSSRPELFEKGTRRRLSLAATSSASDLAHLHAELRRWAETVHVAFANVHLLLLPTIPVDAPAAEDADTVETTAALVPYTHLLSLALIPSLSIPCGFSAGEAPVGAMLAARAWHDGLVHRAGAAFQSVTDWHRRRY